MINELIINKPDDMHLHLREGAILGFVLKDTVSQFARAIVMPNLNTPVTSVALAKKYYDSIKSYGFAHYNFEPLMTLYLTDILSKEEIKKAKESKIIQGIKLYPAGVTTNSKNGISSIDSCYNIFEEMVNYAQTKFKIGKFVSIGYSNTVILKLTENFDIIEFRKKCEERQMLVNPPLSKTSKNKLVREILEEVLKEIGKDEIGNKEFEDKLISNQNFDREQVKEDIMKAMKVGLIQETHKGFFSI